MGNRTGAPEAGCESGAGAELAGGAAALCAIAEPEAHAAAITPQAATPISGAYAADGARRCATDHQLTARTPALAPDTIILDASGKLTIGEKRCRTADRCGSTPSVPSCSRLTMEAVVNTSMSGKVPASVVPDANVVPVPRAQQASLQASLPAHHTAEEIVAHPRFQLAREGFIVTMHELHAVMPMTLPLHRIAAE